MSHLSSKITAVMLLLTIAYTTLFQFLCLPVKAPCNFFTVLSDSPTTLDTSCVQIIKHVQREKKLSMQSLGLTHPTLIVRLLIVTNVTMQCYKRKQPFHKHQSLVNFLCIFHLSMLYRLPSDLFISKYAPPPYGKFITQLEELKMCDKSNLLLRFYVKNWSHFILLL